MYAGALNFFVKMLLFSVPVPISVVLGSFAAAYMWKTLAHFDGVSSGIAKERAAWEEQVAEFEREMAEEKRRAEVALSKISVRVSEQLRERDAAREEARVANAKLLALLNADDEPETIQCEKANETVQCPRCRSCYGVRVDPRILRNVAAGRGQNRLSANP